jgi:hypothetical protein
MPDFKKMTCIELREYIKVYKRDFKGKYDKKELIKMCENIHPSSRMDGLMFYCPPKNYVD